MLSNRYCTCSERLKNIHHVGYYFIRHCGLHWRTIWPLMNPPNNIPFWGPGAMYNSLVRLNLKKNKKKLRFWGFESVRGQIPNIFFVSLESYLKMVPPVKEFFWSKAQVKRYKIFFSQFSGADFSLVISFWVKWTSIPKRAWSQLSKMVWHLTFQ